MFALCSRISNLNMCALRARAPYESLAYPTPLEAVLRAEVALFAEFQTGWTLETARVVLAINAVAATGCGFVPHVDG